MLRRHQDFGINLRALDELLGWNLLHLAVLSGSEGSVRVMLQDNYVKNCGDTFHNLAIDYAPRNESGKEIRSLLSTSAAKRVEWCNCETCTNPVPWDAASGSNPGEYLVHFHIDLPDWLLSTPMSPEY